MSLCKPSLPVFAALGCFCIASAQTNTEIQLRRDFDSGKLKKRLIELKGDQSRKPKLLKEKTMAIYAYNWLNLANTPFNRDRVDLLQAEVDAAWQMTIKDPEVASVFLACGNGRLYKSRTPEIAKSANRATAKWSYATYIWEYEKHSKSDREKLSFLLKNRPPIGESIHEFEWVFLVMGPTFRLKDKKAAATLEQILTEQIRLNPQSQTLKDWLKSARDLRKAIE